MICQKCNNTGILNSALDKHFFYCRECKIEIPLEIVEATDHGYWSLTGEEFEHLSSLFPPDFSVY